MNGRLERDMHDMTPYEREALRLLSSIMTATWTTAILVFLVSVAIVVLSTLGF